ncbi:MAG TPA: (d)CMP kinase [Clostridiales bacterium]|jgi:CMP/dCMP kinase|nr:(d)CMP kinase [Clostridiales bacterium]HQP69228.1 (d)CMP kinase [Clostridiales bacterium]
MIIAIDGPAGSGKSTTAKLVGNEAGFLYIDTGAMYRAMTLKVKNSGIAYSDRERIIELLDSTVIEQIINQVTKDTNTILDGKDVSVDIRTPEISKGVTEVCEISEVRRKLVELQRRMGRNGNVILDGRDIGTVVFPDADLKFFMVADIDIRAERRLKELTGKGIVTTFEDVKDDIERRDNRDSSRSDSPLKPAEDAILIDTSLLTIPQQAALIIGYIRKKI